MQTYLQKIFSEPPWMVEGSSQEYNRESYTLSGIFNLTSLGSIPSGHPMLYGQLCRATDILLSTGLLLDDITGYCDKQKISSVERGHNVINTTLLPKKDYQGNTIDMSAWRMVLDQLGFKVIPSSVQPMAAPAPTAMMTHYSAVEFGSGLFSSGQFGG